MVDSYTPKNYTREEIEAIKIIRQFVEPGPMGLESAKGALDAMRAAGLAIERRPWPHELSLAGNAKEAIAKRLRWKAPEED